MSEFVITKVAASLVKQAMSGDIVLHSTLTLDQMLS